MNEDENGTSIVRGARCWRRRWEARRPRRETENLYNKHNLEELRTAVEALTCRCSGSSNRVILLILHHEGRVREERPVLVSSRRRSMRTTFNRDCPASYAHTTQSSLSPTSPTRPLRRMRSPKSIPPPYTTPCAFAMNPGPTPSPALPRSFLSRSSRSCDARSSASSFDSRSAREAEREAAEDCIASRRAARAALRAASSAAEVAAEGGGGGRAEGGAAARGP